MCPGTSLAVQWLRLQSSTTEGAGSIPGWRTKILHAAQCNQNVKKKKDMENVSLALTKSLPSLDQIETNGLRELWMTDL